MDQAVAEARLGYRFVLSPQGIIFVPIKINGPFYVLINYTVDGTKYGTFSNFELGVSSKTGGTQVNTPILIHAD